MMPLPHLSFLLHASPFLSDWHGDYCATTSAGSGETIHPGPYRMGKRGDDANTYRVGHPLAQRVLALGHGLSTRPAELIFRYGGSGKKIAVLEPLVGSSGWLACTRLTVSAMETEDHLFFAGATDAGEPLDEIGRAHV